MSADDRIRVDTGTASREELVAEVQRLGEVIDRWVTNWHTVCDANSEAWTDRIREFRATTATAIDTLTTLADALRDSYQTNLASDLDVIRWQLRHTLDKQTL